MPSASESHHRRAQIHAWEDKQKLKGGEGPPHSPCSGVLSVIQLARAEIDGDEYGRCKLSLLPIDGEEFCEFCERCKGHCNCEGVAREDQRD